MKSTIQLPYTEPQDRSWKGNAQQWNQVLTDPQTQTLVYWDRQALLAHKNKSYTIAWKPIGELPIDAHSVLIYLGEKEGVHRVALHLAAASAFSSSLAGAASEVWAKPRSNFPLLTSGDAALLAYTEGMVYWRSTHRFCGKCGSKTVPQAGGQLLICQNAQCEKPFYPHINPAVIMLIEAQHPSGEPACLLSQNFRTPDNMATTLAGFVELGETLEQAVAREVFEETQVEVTEVAYLTSQPWPFPSSLMMGFMGSAVYSEPIVDTNELRSARWYRLSELVELVNTGKLLPSRIDSIARYLIVNWMEKYGHSFQG